MKTPRRARSGERGASLVEAVAVIPVFLLFMAGMSYMHRLYTHKLTVESSARSHTMAYALGGCQGDFATVVHANDGNLSQAPPSGVGDPGDIHPQDGNGQLMEQQGGETVATLKHTSSTVQTTFDPGSTFPNATKSSQSSSTAMCDEVPQKGDLPGLIKYAIHLFVP
jgi:hypothetical protein